MLRFTGSRAMVRQFHHSIRRSAASVFNMPAMSPTMTEGGIVEWKFKEGDSFSAGDVLLEVETDKATIDVEAQDDGKLWQILQKDGAKQIPVGKAIAFLAEPEDDLSTLEQPKLDEASVGGQESKPAAEIKEVAAKPAETVSKATKAPAAAKSGSDSSSTASVFRAADPQQKLSPAVELLLHKHNVSREEALKTIPASGPKGRILRADVLAHFGEVNPSAIESVTKFIKSKEHLDLSNIVIKAAEPVPAAAPAAAPKEAPKPQNLLNVSFTGVLGELSKEQFKYAVEQSIKSANILTYKHSFPEFNNSPVASSLSSDAIFDELLVAPATKQRFEVSSLKFGFPQVSPGIQQSSDLFDELIGAPASSVFVPVVETSTPTVDVSFKIKFDEKLVDSKQFVDYFTDSLLSQVPSNNIKVTNAFE